MPRPKKVQDTKFAREFGLELYSQLPDGTPKPNTMIISGREVYYVFYIEGIEGYHSRASIEASKAGKLKSIYLNYGYFLIKPTFHTLNNVRTSDPQPKKRKMNGKEYRMGIFEVMDVKTKQEQVLWCYTLPFKLTEWENLKVHIDKALFELQQAGIKPREDGYMPAVFKIGKTPIGPMGLKFATVVGFAVEDQKLTLDLYSKINDPQAIQLNGTTNKSVTEYENEEGVRFINDTEQ